MCVRSPVELCCLVLGAAGYVRQDVQMNTRARTHTHTHKQSHDLHCTHTNTHTHTHTHTWQGPSALHLACEKGHSDAVCALVDLGADVNSLTSELTTPLHYAVENGRKGVCVTSD